MDCPQCAADVPTDNAFCGKCGYAMRDEGPDRTDQSRIRVHEEPTPTNDDRPSRPSSPRIRKHTVLGMPPASVRAPDRGTESGPPPPPSPIAAARAGRKARQKTMVGIPRPDFPATPQPPVGEVSSTDADATDEATNSTRVRAHVQYDSVLEPPAAAARRRRVFAVGAGLVALSAGWLIYRFLNG